MAHDASGRATCLGGITLDVTERKYLELELERAKSAAEQANRAKDHFLAVLSHELRNPLTPVMMAVSVLQRKPEFDPKVREMLEMVRRNVELEARLIDDLLDVSRIARGKIELHRSAVALSTIIERAVEVCKPDIEARKLHFGVDMGRATPYWVEADVSRLQQVFWNLLKNAVKFTPHGGCVGIRCRPNENHVLVEVNDSGMGIDPEALSRIFNAFEQAERSVTQQFGGLGLGLAISRALVEMHGGQIEAYSEGRDKGATFRVRLPLTAPAHQPETPAPAVPPLTRRPPFAHFAGRGSRRNRKDDEDGTDPGRPYCGNGWRCIYSVGASEPEHLRSADERSRTAGWQRPRTDVSIASARASVPRHCAERLWAGRRRSAEP